MQTLPLRSTAPTASAAPHAAGSAARQDPNVLPFPPIRPVTLTVRVGISDAALARRALQQLPGAASDLCVVVDLDRKRDVACLHVELDGRQVGAAMSLLMHALPSGEFGPVRHLARHQGLR